MKRHAAQDTQISPRQMNVLKHIGQFQNRCYSITIGELAAELGISRPTAFEHVAALREKNLLLQSNGKARSLRLTPDGEKLLKQTLRFEASKRPRRPAPGATIAPKTDALPAWNGLCLRGRVSAGYGIEAIEEQTPFSIADVFGTHTEMFVLQVCGSSMKDAGIFNGDYVLCRAAQTAENGQLVVALLDNRQNATLKRFYKDANAVRLQPANDAFEPILSRDCRIQAIVIGVVRRM